ncbi:MAG: FAD-dependent oxidoreductase [Candidatus Omnitrophota bacterium]
MNNIVIIGASASSHNIALRLREKLNAGNITLVSEENYPAYDHLRLADFISGIVSEKDMFLCSEDFYAKQGINFLKGKKVSILNTQKKLIYFKDKGRISYDFLVLATGRSPVLPDIPGARKDGVWRLYSLSDAKEFLKSYIAGPVCVAGTDVFALKIAEAVTEKYKVEVKLLSQKSFDPGLIPKNVEVLNDSIQEIIGEGEAQAVKLASGKAIGISAVLFMNNYKSNIEFLKDTPVAVENDLVIVDGSMQATVKDIFACGSITGKDSIVISMMLADGLISQVRGDICRIS